jgi:hypothetical protein
MSALKKIYVVLSLLMLTGCGEVASSSRVFTADGEKGYVLNCSGINRNWGQCYEKAGDLCEIKGYEVLEVTGEAGTQTAVKSSSGLSTATTTTTHNRIMVMKCKESAMPETSPHMPTRENAAPVGAGL